MTNNGKQLHGLRILNTRPEAQGILLSKTIIDAGGIAIPFPALTIEATDNNWLNHLGNLTSIHQSIFISANAVNYFFATLKQHHITWPISIETTAIGKASAAALEKWSIRNDHLPVMADSEHLLQLQSLQEVRDQRILLVKGEGGKPDIETALDSKGARVIALSVYKRVLPNIDQQDIQSLWQDDRVDIILFTSQQAMHHIFLLFGEQARNWLCSKPCVVISERLAQEAFKLGIQTVIISHYDRILNTLEGLSHDNQQRCK